MYERDGQAVGEIEREMEGISCLLSLAVNIFYIYVRERWTDSEGDREREMEGGSLTQIKREGERLLV